MSLLDRLEFQLLFFSFNKLNYVINNNFFKNVLKMVTYMIPLSFNIMKSSIKKLLLPYQIDHVINLSKKLSNNFICFDCSDTGTGKTYSAIATAKCLKMKVFIICPKTIMSAWHEVVGGRELQSP